MPHLIRFGIVLARSAGALAPVQVDQEFHVFDFRPAFVPKAANFFGLQLADLAAGPSAQSQLRTNQPNRAFEMIRPKLGRLGHLPGSFEGAKTKGDYILNLTN